MRNVFFQVIKKGPGIGIVQYLMPINARDMCSEFLLCRIFVRRGSGANFIIIEMRRFFEISSRIRFAVLILKHRFLFQFGIADVSISRTHQTTLISRNINENLERPSSKTQL